MNQRASRRLLAPILLATACVLWQPVPAAAQETRPKAPVPSKTGTPPNVRNMLLLAVLLGVGLGVNAIPSKRGHQD